MCSRFERLLDQALNRLDGCDTAFKGNALERGELDVGERHRERQRSVPSRLESDAARQIHRLVRSDVVKFPTHADIMALQVEARKAPISRRVESHAVITCQAASSRASG